MNVSNFLRIKICYLNINRVFAQVIHVFTNYFQLLMTYFHLFMTPFDCNSSLETHGVFLDISKAFDRVWHDGLIFKLKQNGVSGNSFQLIKSFPSGRFSRVLFNGQTSEWVIIQAALSQDLILGAIFFLIYILMTQQAN